MFGASRPAHFIGKSAAAARHPCVMGHAFLTGLRRPTCGVASIAPVDRCRSTHHSQIMQMRLIGTAHRAMHHNAAPHEHHHVHGDGHKCACSHSSAISDSAAAPVATEAAAITASAWNRSCFARPAPSAIAMLSRSGLRHGGLLSSNSTAVQRRFHGHSHDTVPAANDGEPKKAPIPVSVVLKTVATHLWPKDRWDLRACVVGSVLCVMSAKVLKVAVPFWFKTIIDALAPGCATASAAATVVGPFTLGIFALVTAYGITRMTAVLVDEAKTAVFAPVGGAAATTIAVQLFNKLHALDLRFHLNRQTGVLSKDLDRGSRAFWSLAFALVFTVFPTIFEMGLVAAVLQKQAGFVLVATASSSVLLYVAWTYVVTNWRAKYRDRYNAADSKVGGMIVDSLLNFETVKYFTNEAYEAKRISGATADMNGQLVKLDQTMAVLNFGQQAIFVTAAAVSLFLCTQGVLAGAMTVGDLVLVDALLIQLYVPLSFLGMIYREVQSSTQNMQAMLGILHEKEAIRDDEDAKAFAYVDGTIELKNVSFHYKPNRRVLDDVSLTIPGGKTVAFVGPSGSGKSTIFRLLYRFFDPVEGSILVDGQDIRRLQIDSFRREVGVVPQDTVLFNDTLSYNIGYGRAGEATEEQIREAARKANVHESIMTFPDGYDTVVGERGLKLSGGEKQRVAIARVILKDAPILFADEATSALDTQTERKVMATLKSAAAAAPVVSEDGNAEVDTTVAAAATRRRTLVIIAHRLTTIKDADIIFVLNRQGQLAEQGTHDELIAFGGIYRTLWDEQTRSSKLDAGIEDAEGDAEAEVDEKPRIK